LGLSGAISVCGHGRADQPIHSVASNDSELKVWLKAAGPVIISYLEIDPAKHRLDLTTTIRQGGSSLREFLSDETATVAFTGGYLKSFSPPRPTGYLRIDGVDLNGLVRDDPIVNAILCFGREGPGLTSVSLFAAKTFRSEDAGEDCVQAGPLLIAEGRVGYDLTRRDSGNRLSGEFERAFLAINRQGQVLLGVSSAVSLMLLRHVLSAPTTEGGFDAQAAVILSGATTAGMEVRGGLGYAFGTVSALSSRPGFTIDLLPGMGRNGAPPEECWLRSAAGHRQRP
jgi:hypothetical protein